MDIKKLVKKGVLSLTAYSAKEIPCKIKLDANESPYDFPFALDAAAGVKTNRYPDPEALGLRKLLAKETGVAPENILLGNGSDELIYNLIAVFGGPVMYPTPTFSMYGIIATTLGEKKIEVPLDEDFDIDIEASLSAIEAKKPKIIFLASPNNPTGNCYCADGMLKLLESSGCIVVVDEAYQAFAGKDGFMPLLKDYPNLVIMRTLSKIGLAALRVGFMAASAEIIQEVNKVRLPFNVNALSQAAALSALGKKSRISAKIRLIVSQREKLYRELSKTGGVEVFPSEANFILFRVGDADRVHARLLEKGILIRNMSSAVEGCLRVTVGTPDENAAFVKAIREILRD